MTVQDLKLTMIQAILENQEPDLLQKAAKALQKVFNGISYEEVDEKEYDANEMTFEEWNEQFTDDRPLEEFIPEHGMTLRAFREKIFEAERSEYLTEEEFNAELKTTINEFKEKYVL